MKSAIRQLDQRFKALRPLSAAARPPKGWIRAVRDALGMTTKQMAQRFGVAQPRIIELEQAEISGSITLQSLERAAQALGCRVVYALVPERPLAERVQERAERLADQQLANVEQTMTLENQSAPNKQADKRLRQELIEKLLRKPARLWDTL